MATGPKAWNDWISALLRDLFFKVLNILKKGELATHEAVAIVDEKMAEIIRSAPDGNAAKEMKSLLHARPLSHRGTPAAPGRERPGTEGL